MCPQSDNVYLFSHYRLCLKTRADFHPRRRQSHCRYAAAATIRPVPTPASTAEASTITTATVTAGNQTETLKTFVPTRPCDF
ncbi:hypothetical protein SprV_0200687600 [Sparganum proliferum]